ARPEVAGEDPQGRRLAGAVEAEEAARLAVGDLERDRAEGPLASVVLRDVLGSNHPTDLAGGLRRAGGRRRLRNVPRSPDGVKSLERRVFRRERGDDGAN